MLSFLCPRVGRERGPTEGVGPPSLSRVCKMTRRADNQSCERFAVFCVQIPGLKGRGWMIGSFRTRLAGEAGQTLVEYAILMILIAVITVALLTSTGTSLA